MSTTTCLVKKNSASLSLDEQLRLWVLRVIFKANKFKMLFRRDGFSDEDLAIFLGLESYLTHDTLVKQEIKEVLFSQWKILEKKQSLTCKTFHPNILALKKLFKLTWSECSVVELCALLHTNDAFADYIDDLFGNSLTAEDTIKAIGYMLNFSQSIMKKIFHQNGIIQSAGLITIEKGSTQKLRYKVDLINDEFAENLLSYNGPIEDLFSSFVKPCLKENDLGLRDYDHIKEDITILHAYLKAILDKKSMGSNILLYGAPGTGKTELCKVIAKSLNVKLYEVSYTDGTGFALDGFERLKAYKVAQSIIRSNRAVLLYDEAEDVFESHDSFFIQSRQKEKAWINRALETNKVPTIWVTNNINTIDRAIVRRFDLAIEVPVPSKKQRIKIIQKTTQGKLEKDFVEQIATHEHLAPALLASATKVVSMIEPKSAQKCYTRILSNTLKAQGYEEIGTASSAFALPKNYNPSLINASANLSHLTQGIISNPNARLCLYGPAGTGKSAYGKYLAEQLNKPMLLKKGSDLISKWVGESEKNIANAFEEARDEKAVLVFDEVDSFLMDRSEANQLWQ
ncbi:MAG: AAA family ATPase, partial [Campylobacteraceae bacterium]|nr:AAA family ATPase [Campylobacteraceae bacterium]